MAFLIFGQNQSTIHKSTQCFFSYFFVWYFVRTNIQPDWLNKNSGHIYLQYSVKCIFSNLSGILKQRKSRCVYFSPIYYVLHCYNIPSVPPVVDFEGAELIQCSAGFYICMILSGGPGHFFLILACEKITQLNLAPAKLDHLGFYYKPSLFW